MAILATLERRVKANDRNSLITPGEALWMELCKYPPGHEGNELGTMFVHCIWTRIIVRDKFECEKARMKAKVAATTVAVEGKSYLNRRMGSLNIETGV